MPLPDWFDFLQPDYDSVFLQRQTKLKKIRETPGMLAGLKEHYKDNPVDFINDWGMTCDPRNAEIGLPVNVPFLLFPKQEEFIDWLRDRWQQREDGLGEKSRDMGVSWLCVAFAVWMWLFHDGTVVGFGSRKEEYVDKLGDPKSLFWKVRKFIEMLPKEFRPEGYDEKANALFMRIINPVNESVIVGESGDNIGRGNRASVYFVDEAAFIERQDNVDAALSQTSNCKIYVSTPNGNGNAFYRKRMAGRIPLFTFHWKDDPRKDEHWYRDQKNKLDAVILAQEVDIDYNASNSEAWINGDRITDAQMVGVADIENIGQWRVGIDAAHMGDDESVITLRKARVTLPQITMRKANGHQLGARVEEECRSLEAVGEYIEALVIELDGPGVSCYDWLRRPTGRWRDRVVGVHTGVRLKDNQNYNVRALLWRRGRDYLKDTPVSMPNCQTMKSQLGSMKYSYRDGLLLMQNKKQYKKDFGGSPDRADSWILTFADIDLALENDEWYDDDYHHDDRDTIGGY